MLRRLERLVMARTINASQMIEVTESTSYRVNIFRFRQAVDEIGVSCTKHGRGYSMMTSISYMISIDLHTHISYLKFVSGSR